MLLTWLCWTGLLIYLWVFVSRSDRAAAFDLWRELLISRQYRWELLQRTLLNRSTPQHPSPHILSFPLPLVGGGLKGRLKHLRTMVKKQVLEKIKVIHLIQSLVPLRVSVSSINFFSSLRLVVKVQFLPDTTLQNILKVNVIQSGLATVTAPPLRVPTSTGQWYYLLITSIQGSCFNPQLLRWNTGSGSSILRHPPSFLPQHVGSSEGVFV